MQNAQNNRTKGRRNNRRPNRNNYNNNSNTMQRPPTRGRQLNVIDRNAMLQQAYGKVYQNRLNFLPPWIEAPMRYSEQLTVSVAAGSVTDYIYRANSLFDPNRTGTGHQPLGFDQLAGVYNRYRVDRLAWYVEMPSVTMTYSAAVCLINGAETITSIEEILEYPTARLHTIGYSGAPPAIFTGKKYLPPFNGRSELAYNIDDTTASEISTNPVETIDFHIVVNNPTAGSITVTVTVNLNYRAVFFDPVTPSQSFKRKEKMIIEAFGMT